MENMIIPNKEISVNMISKHLVQQCESALVNQDEEALEKYGSALIDEISGKECDTEINSISLLFFRISLYYFLKEQYTVSLKFVEKCLRYFISHQDDSEKSKFLLHKSKTLAKLKDYQSAIITLKALLMKSKAKDINLNKYFDLNTKTRNLAEETALSLEKSKKFKKAFKVYLKLYENLQNHSKNYQNHSKNYQNHTKKGKCPPYSENSVIVSGRFSRNLEYSVPRHNKTQSFYQSSLINSSTIKSSDHRKSNSKKFGSSLNKYFSDCDDLKSNSNNEGKKPTLKNNFFLKNFSKNHTETTTLKEAVTDPTPESLLKLNLQKKENYNEERKFLSIKAPKFSVYALIGKKFRHNQNNSAENYKIYESGNTSVIEETQVPDQFIELANNTQKPLKNTYNLESIIKIQAQIRKVLCREKFMLLKNKPKVLRIGAKLINHVTFHIKIIKCANSILITAFNSVKEYRLELPLSTDINKIVQGLQMNDSNSLEYAEEDISLRNYKLVKKKGLIFNNEPVEVNYFKTSYGNSLLITLIYNDKTLETELKHKFENNEHLNFTIDHCIHNYLEIKDNISLNYPRDYSEKQLIYSGVKKNAKKEEFIFYIYKLSNEIEIFVTNSSQNFKKFTFFPIDFILKTLELVVFTEQSYLLLFLYLEFSTEISFKSKSFLITFVGSCKKQIGKCDYLLKMHKFKEKKLKYLFECINPDQPQVASIVISGKKLKNISGIQKNVEKSYDLILSSLRISNQRLYFIDRNVKQVSNFTPSLRLMKAVIKLQSLYRGHRLRDQILLENTKKVLLTTESKLIHRTKFIISIYKLEWGLLVEAINSVTLEISYKFIDEPRKYVSQLNKFSDLSKIIQAIRMVNNKLAISRTNPNEKEEEPYYSYFVIGEFVSIDKSFDSNWPVFIKKEVNGIEYIVQGNLDKRKNLIATFISTEYGKPSYSREFTEEEIVKLIGVNDPKSLLSSLRISYGKITTSDLFIHSNDVVADEILNSKIICKVSIKYGQFMFLICASFIENFENYDESLLVFYARLNSSLDRCRKTEITLKNACEISGFNKKSLVFMTEYIIKNMVLINHVEFYIDKSRPPMNFEKIVRKMQAFVRGCRVRTTLHVKILVLYKENKNISNAHITILFYLYNSKYFFATVNKFHVDKLEVSYKFFTDFENSPNKKMFFLKEIFPKFILHEKGFKLIKESQNLVKNTKSLASPSEKFSLTNRRFSKIGTFSESFQTKTSKDSNLMILEKTEKFTVNHVVYTSKLYNCGEKFCVEIFSGDHLIASKNLNKESFDFEAFLKIIHIDTNHGKIFVEKKRIFDDVCTISDRKVSLIIYENKIGCYADAFILDSRKHFHFFLGENIRVNSILAKLRIFTNSKGERLALTEY